MVTAVGSLKSPASEINLSMAGGREVISQVAKENRKAEVNKETEPVRLRLLVAIPGVKDAPRNDFS